MKTWKRIIRIVTSSCSVFCCILFTPLFTNASEISIATPGIGTEGNTFALEPFGLADLNVPSLRYQQVYSASELLTLIPEGGIITKLIFRSDGTFGRGFSAGYPSAQIDMSVTTRNPDQLSTVFADNIGSFAATVYPRAGLTIGSGGPGTPNTEIALQTPYIYNPADGNLLLDIQIFARGIGPPYSSLTAGPMDAENNGFGPDTVSRVFAYDVNATSGTADSIGLITFFRVTPIPEPSTSALLLAALVAVGMCGHRRKRRTLDS